MFRLMSRRGDDTGFAMLTVIAMGLVLTIAASVVISLGINSLTQARNDRYREQAIQLADGATNATVQQVLKGAQPPTIAYPGDYAGWSAACEKAWVLWAAASPTSTTSPLPPCAATGATWNPPTSPLPTLTNGTGRWVALYVSTGVNVGVVYGIGLAPAVSARSVRVVRMDVQINTSTSYQVSDAILANTDLKMTQSGSVQGTYGIVHTNGAITYTGSGKVSGNISWSTDCPAGSTNNCTNARNASCGTSQPAPNCSQANSTLNAAVPVPSLSATSFYQYATYVMCPDGKVHPGPAYTGSLGTAPLASTRPCSLNDAFGTNLNWSYNSSSRLWSYSSAQDSTGGTWYFYQTSAQVSGSGQMNGTLIAQGDGTACGSNGSITYTGSGGFVPTLPSALGGSAIAMLADGPLTATAAGSIFSGVLYTNQWFKFTGSGSGFEVAVIGNDTNSCGLNQVTGSGSFSNNGNFTVNIPQTPSATQNSWLEI